MADEFIDEEWSIMYEESAKTKVLDSDTFKKPVKNIKVKKPLMLDVGKMVSDAVEVMQQKNMGCVLIVKGGKLAGILTERDILMKLIGSGKDFGKVKVEDIMTRDPQAFQPEDSVAFVLNAMAVGGYRHVPIVDQENRPVAVVSMKDIVNFIVEHFPEEVINLPPRPIRHTDQIDGG
jgi:CBS domain-containing protein